MKKKYLSLAFILGLLTSCVSKTYDVMDYRLTMEFHDDFKILQLTDLHFGIESHLESQFAFVKQSINEANPDLIILTGDNFMYASKAIVKNTFTFINECCKELSTPERVVKFAVTYGNHDNQGDYSRYYLNNTMNLFTTSNGREIVDNKYALFVDYEDDDLFGFTNYYIDLIDKNNNDDIKYRLHIIDSNTYYNQGIKYGYDTIREDQLNHLINISKNDRLDQDYIGLSFFHIPLVNYLEAIHQYENASDPSKVGQGSFKDKFHKPYKDNNSYQYFKDANIIASFVGHDHTNYGDILYTDKEGDLFLFSYGVKSTNQLYHDDDKIGYKTINLKDNITKDEFLNMTYVSENIKNVITRGGDYNE